MSFVIIGNFTRTMMNSYRKYKTDVQELADLSGLLIFIHLYKLRIICLKLIESC